MIAPLFLRNLRHHARLLLALTAGLAAFETLLVVLFAKIDTGPGLPSFLEQLAPAPVRALLRSQFGLFSFSGGVGFGFQHPVVLVGTLAFVVAAATLPAAERESGLLDLLLSRRASRDRYLAAVAALVVLGALLLPAGVLVGASTGLAIVDVPSGLPWSRYAFSAAALCFLLLGVGGGALALASGSPRRGPVVARVVGIVLVLYVVETFADLWWPFDRVRWLSPFRYFKPIQAALSGTLRATEVAVLLALFVVGAAIGFRRFRRADV